MKYRDVTCGNVNTNFTQKNIILAGWVDRIREVGGVTFILLRDHTGIVQLTASTEELISKAHSLHNEDVIRVEGMVQKRSEKEINSAMKTGEIEVILSDLAVLNECKALPFEVRKSMTVDENIRMQYRYLDLRNPSMRKNMEIRHAILQATRNYLSNQSFLEIETPYLGKSTPEGARDFLVPSRKNPGKFYALTQSPQLYKEMLMVGGVDRYFQICRCFRDEDFRVDRQPEFTQIDLEMAFADEAMLHEMLEGLMKEIAKKALGQDIDTPFPVLSYEDAMNLYGTDKPDLRFEYPIATVTEHFHNPEYKAFYTACSEGKTITALRLPQEYMAFSRKQSDAFVEELKTETTTLFYVKHKESGIGLNFLTAEDAQKIAETVQSKPGDAVLFVMGTKSEALTIAGRARSALGQYIFEKEPTKKDKLCFAWIHEFPLFLWNEDENSLDSAQHPFTAPNMEQYSKYIDSDPLQIRSRSSDMVLNGFELGSGGERISDPALQIAIFKKIGLTEEQIQEQFDYLLDALSFGAPPEAGFALGVDRIAMLFTKSTSLRDVIAFPKNTRGASPLTKEPAPISEEQWKEVLRRDECSTE